MNILRKITITACLLVLRPSFAAQSHTAESPLVNSLLLWLIWGVFTGLYFLPSVYYALRYRKCSLSLNSLLIPHLAFASLVLIGVFHYELGLNPFLFKLMDSVSATVVFIVFCILALFSWSYPAFYAYNQEIKREQH